MMQSPDKAIRRATMVAKGLAKEIGPLPTSDHPKPPHPASMIPGVHVTGMGDEHTAIPDGYADGGDVGDMPEPQKTVKAYKLFKTKNGKLYPLFVNANKPVPVGQWLTAEEGPQGKSQGRVKSTLGDLAYRPGWHSGDLPVATHIGAKSHADLKAPDTRPSNHVWAEVEHPADVDWQSVANSRARMNAKGEPIPNTAHITDQVPHGGFYRYKTNPNMSGNWLISGGMKVNRVLGDDEVKAINDAHGVADLPRRPGFADGGDVTSNPNFSQWFGNSVTHDNGVPRTYYTGTSKDKDFTSFNVGRHGAWFTTDPHEASQYAESNDSQGHVWENGRFQPTNTASRVIPAYLKAENPYTGERPEALNRAQNYKKAQSDWFDQLRAAGHDAWIPSSLKGNLAVMLRHPTQIKSAIGNSGAFDPKQKAIHKADGGDVEPTDETGFDAWHGTPHTFAPEPGAPLGRFRSDKIGTGEGAQAYGHGLYLANSQGIAKSYKEKLSGIQQITDETHPLFRQAFEDKLNEIYKKYAEEYGISVRTLKKMEGSKGNLADVAKEQMEPIYENKPGHLLHVRVRANPEHFLDWDKPLSEQHPRVQSALAGVTDLESIKFGGDAYQALANQMADKKGRGNFAGASAALHAAGIPGIRYLDANSRGPTGNPTHNHVIFDPSIIDIKHRYARGGDVKPAGATTMPDDTVNRALQVARAHYGDGGTPILNVAQSVMQKPTEDHPAWIPQRLITSKAAQSPTDSERNLVDLNALKLTPKLYQSHTDLLRNYPNIPDYIARHGTADEVAESFINHIQDNLLALHDAVPSETRNRSKLWYDGANRIANEWAKKYNIPVHSAAGALAALSPQKDWYQNVSLAHRVMEMMKGGNNFYNAYPADEQMRNQFGSMPSLQKPEYQHLYSLIHGKTLGDIDKEDWPDNAKRTAKALWIRLHDETHNPRSYHIVTPEGGYSELARNADGSESKVGWGSLPEIAKAIGAIESGDNPAALSNLMGEKHKVRNFYNNILSPNSKHGDVTIDTHAVAAGLYRPLSGKSVEVAHNFGNYAGKGIPNAGGSAISGVQGTYPLYAEAYRRAAEKRGILPREMQSITWEAVRGLFPEVFKKGKNVAKIDSIWDNYKSGKLTQQQAREQVNAIAAPQGIRPPTWEEGRPTGLNESGGSSLDQGALSKSVLPGASPARINPRAGRRTAAAVPQGTIGGSSPPVEPKFATGGDVVFRALQLTKQHAPVPAAFELARNLMPGRR